MEMKKTLFSYNVYADDDQFDRIDDFTLLSKGFTILHARRFILCMLVCKKDFCNMLFFIIIIVQ